MSSRFIHVVTNDDFIYNHISLFSNDKATEKMYINVFTKYISTNTCIGMLALAMGGAESGRFSSGLQCGCQRPITSVITPRDLTDRNP